MKRCGNLGGDEYTVLGNALAILAGLELDKEYVCEKIVNGELTDCSLSMKISKYDALLATDKEKYQKHTYDKSRNFGFVITFKFIKQSATDSAMCPDDICYHRGLIGLKQCNDNYFLRNIATIHLWYS